jgi:hypothetical protein
MATGFEPAMPGAKHAPPPQHGRPIGKRTSEATEVKGRKSYPPKHKKKKVRKPPQAGKWPTTSEVAARLGGGPSSVAVQSLGAGAAPTGMTSEY